MSMKVQPISTKSTTNQSLYLRSARYRLKCMTLLIM
jgi:hypothetical protein